MIITKQVRLEIRERRATRALVDGVEMPGSVAFLRAMSETVEPDDRDEVLGELAGEYLRAGMENEHLAVQRERVSFQPASATSWLGLAHSLSMRPDGFEEAKTAAATGLAIAREHASLIRFALLCQADIARRIKDTQLFESSLKALIEDAPNERDEDSWLSETLVDALPDGFCDPELVSQYRRVIAGDFAHR